MSLWVSFSFVTGRLCFAAVAEVTGLLIGPRAAFVNYGKSSLGLSAVFDSGVSVEELWLIPCGVPRLQIAAFIAVFSWRSPPTVSFMVETSLSSPLTKGARDSDSWFPAELAVVWALGSGAYSSRSFFTCSTATLLWHFEHSVIRPQCAVPALVKEPTSRHSGFGLSTSGCTFSHSFSNSNELSFVYSEKVPELVGITPIHY